MASLKLITRRALPAFVLLLATLFIFKSHQSTAQTPLIGAQVWIEPGQKPEDIDRWFKILSEQNMPVARLFVMWNYIEMKPGQWDFTYYDRAFDAAAKYNVKIVATLTPNHGPPHADEGYWYRWQEGLIPRTQQQLDLGREYIKKTVSHYANHPALDTWMLMNEPGQLEYNNEWGMSRYRVWLKEKYGSIDKLNESWATGFASFNEIEYSKHWQKSGGFIAPNPYYDWQNFGRNHLTWYMKHIASNIRRIDKTHDLHVNPHGIFDIIQEYELPEWSTFLNSMGASIHPSWHFGLFKKKDYGLAVSAVCEIIKGSTEPKPFWVTELQGGNNLYSGVDALNPSPKDISRWVWTGIGSGAKRVIFWSLNGRATGGEAGEWTLLNFQNEPSERLQQASQIAKTINDHKYFFEEAKALDAPVTILLSPETMDLLWRKDIWDDEQGRKRQAHIQEALGFFRALHQLGIRASLKTIDNYEPNSKNNQTIILPHAASLTSSQINKIKGWAHAGNKLIVTGLSGFFDEDENSVLKTGFPLATVTGGLIEEIKYLTPEHSLTIDGHQLPAHIWQTQIKVTNSNAKIIATGNNGQTLALRNGSGKGQVIWVPSLIGMGAWLYDDAPLAHWLSHELKEAKKNQPFSFQSAHKNINHQILKNGKRHLTVTANSGSEAVNISFNLPKQAAGNLLTKEGSNWNSLNGVLTVPAGSTAVMLWE